MIHLLTETNLFSMLIGKIEEIFNSLWYLFTLFPLLAFVIVIIVGILKTKWGLHNCDYEQTLKGKSLIRTAIYITVGWFIVVALIEILFAIF